MKLGMKLKFKFSYFFVLSAAVPFAVCAQDAYLSEEDFYEEELTSPVVVSDPLESINRYTFKFNDFVYTELLDPLARGYQAVTPDPVERGASNFFKNLRYPIRLTGNVLQARWSNAWHETKRFAVNTTVGIVGVRQVADTMEGLGPIPAEDVGQALGAWGIPEGPYLIVPILGPMTLRDVGGYIGDVVVHPTREPFSLIGDWDWEWQTLWGTTEFIVASPALMRNYNEMKGSAIDPYSSLKNGYIQLRRAKIAE